MLALTGFYAALFALILIWLSFRVIALRKSLKAAHGTAGDDQLERRRNAHSNFIEYIPLALILMATAEASNTSVIILHAIGIALIIGRLLHAVGMTSTPENFSFRKIGMMLTFASLVALAAINILRAVQVMLIV